MSLYLGFDCSTQSLKAVLIDVDHAKIVDAHSVSYGRDLPEFRCPEGALENSDPLVKHADPLLWAAALDLLLKQWRDSGAPLDCVSAIGGAAQQHGSVYLNRNFVSVIGALNFRQTLAEQLAPALSRKTSPMWMDSSTGAECVELTDALCSRLQELTGSPAIERFAGPQIGKFWRTQPREYQETSRVHLVSSFLCSILIGADAGIDLGDGAGMNLLNLETLSWDSAIVEATAPDLMSKLPEIRSAPRVEGILSPYFSKYGFRSDVPVVTWTGDNPASLIGSGGSQKELAVISLGTSDTFFAAMNSYRVDPDGFGHVFGLPSGGFMALTCFKNGSLARERLREQLQVDWTFFGGEAFHQTEPGNGHRWALPWFEPEITPLVTRPGLRANFDFAAAEAAVKIRAVVEAQAMLLRIHSLWIGNFQRLRITGGASLSEGIAQSLADVFNAPIEAISTTDSAALGAAMIAAHVASGMSHDMLADRFCPSSRTIKPRPEAAQVYIECLPEFRDFVQVSRN
jgi:xylulokinase